MASLTNDNCNTYRVTYNCNTFSTKRVNGRTVTSPGDKVVVRTCLVEARTEALARKFVLDPRNVAYVREVTNVEFVCRTHRLARVLPGVYHVYVTVNGADTLIAAVHSDKRTTKAYGFNPDYTLRNLASGTFASVAEAARWCSKSLVAR
jgi:hypothetical protein